MKYKSFEKYIQEVLKNMLPINNCLLTWEEHKARYIFNNKGKAKPEIIKGQVIDITGFIYGFHVSIEVKETTLERVTVNSYLSKKQKIFLTEFSKHPNCISMILFYFHKNQKMFLLKYPLIKKVISFNTLEDTSVGIFYCERHNLSFQNFTLEIARLIWS